jgi:DNA topoisomerase IB
MMIESGIRVGNEDSADGYVSKAKKTEGQVLKTYGLTTLLHEHISFPKPGTMLLSFIGKKSVQHDISIVDPVLVKVGRQFYDLNQARWLSLPNGTEIVDKDVNNFIRKSISSGFTAKDFRAFKANIEAARFSLRILDSPAQSKKKEINEEIKQIVLEVSKILGNGPGIARRSYINPQILYRHWNTRGFVIELKKHKGKVKELITLKTK